MTFLFDLLKDVIHDTWTMLPLLYITYIVLEFFERKQTTDDRLFFGLQKLGPILGAFIGLIPQCGFSILAAMLFVQNNITLGTLISVMIATSDEAIPILISNPDMYSSLLWILVLKFIIAMIVGMITDHILFPHQKILRFEDMEDDEEEQDEYEEDQPEASGCPCCYPEYPMLVSALIRSLKIYVFIFITSFVLTFAMSSIGENNLSMILLQNSLLQPVLASLFGFIPNCAATVVLTQLFTSGELSFGSLLAGLITNAGLGLVVMFRYDARKKDILRVISILFITAICTGILFMVF